MKVAILEYICGSGIFRDCVPEGTNAELTSLLAEGYAMLSALTNDMIDSGVEVRSPLEPSIEAWPRWRTWTDSQWTWSAIPYDAHRSLDEVATRWIEAISNCDAAIVIAPELDRILQQLVARLRNAGVVVLASDEPFLNAASDQWETCQAWKRGEVHHPETYLLDDFLRVPREDAHSRRWLIKRRDSAGCVGLQAFEDVSSLVREAVSQRDLRKTPDRWVVQPWIPGIAASMAVLCGQEHRVLGAFEQRIEPWKEEDPTEWCYRGGAGPIPGVNQQALQRFAEQVLQAIPGQPRGWIGIDFVIEPDGRWCAIEVNPRLTTSYLGYRKWYGHSLAGCWARGDSPSVDWQDFSRVSFSVEAFEG